jgi:hypothetical protein
VSRKRIFGAALASAIVIGIGVASTASGAPTEPALTLKVAKAKNVTVKWSFAALPTRDGSAIEIERSVNSGAFSRVQKASRPKPSASWTDKNAPQGALQYRARLVVNNSAQTFGPVAAITVGTTPTTTVPPSTPGAYRWSRAFGGEIGDVSVLDVATAPDGDAVYVARFTVTANFGDGARTAAGSGDIAVVRVSDTGQVRWVRQFGASGSDFDFVYGVDIDSSGAVYIGGIFKGTVAFGNISLVSAESSPGAQQADGFVAKLSPTGTVLWARRMGGPAGDAVMSVSVGNGRVGVTGRWTETSSTTTLFGVLDAASGADIVAPRSEGGSGYAIGYGVAVDAAGRVTVAGTFQGSTRVAGGTVSSAGANDVFVGQYDANNAPTWRKNVGGAGSENLNAIAVNPNGDLALTGSFAGTVNFGANSLTAGGITDVFVARYSSSGAGAWARQFGGSSTFTAGESVDDVAIDASGNVYAAGAIVPAIDFGTGLLSGLAQDPFLVKLAPNGTTRWAQRYTTTSIWPYNLAGGVAFAPDGGAVLVGTFKADIVIGGIRHRNANDSYSASSDGFIARIGP